MVATLPEKFRVSLRNGGGEREFWRRHPEAQLYHEMSPTEFIGLAVEGKSVWRRYEEWKDDDWFVALCTRIRRSLPVDPPRLAVDSGTCKVRAHEGRHRAASSRACGLKKLPVVILCVRGAWDPDWKSVKYRPDLAESCVRCLHRLRPQTHWDTQHIIYEILGSPVREKPEDSDEVSDEEEGGRGWP